MRKKILFMIYLAIIMNTALVGQVAVAATTSITWPIGIIIAAGPIDLHAIVPPMHFGWVGLSNNIFSNQVQGNPRCTIENRGYATIDYTVSATITSSGFSWAMGSTLGNVGVDQCVVAAIFTAAILESEVPFPDGRDLVLPDFANNDVVRSIAVTATTNIFARDNSGLDPDDPEFVKGYNVPAVPSQSVRSLRFLVQTPTMDTTGAEQFFNITIGAIVK